MSCSYFEGSGADFLARRVVLGPARESKPLAGEAQVIVVKGNTGSGEAPEELRRSDGSFACEVLENERAVLRIRVVRTGENTSPSAEEHVLPLGQALFAHTCCEP